MELVANFKGDAIKTHRRPVSNQLTITGVSAQTLDWKGRFAHVTEKEKMANV